MNRIEKRPLNSIGYNFIPEPYRPEGKDEYHLRNIQNRSGIVYRNLSAYEIEVLVRNNNTSDDWAKLLVSNAFNPELVKNCKFFGLVRIGKLEPVALEFHNVSMPVGLYNSTIISCDFGDNVVVSNVNYMANYIVGNEVMLQNIHELTTTNHAKFGNGVLKQGEAESVRIWLEVCNENAGRKILPFVTMMPGDAYLWSKHRDDDALMQRFKELTDNKFDPQRGFYGKIGDRSVIKNTSIIKDVWVGSDAYIKGANKLKNLTLNSSPESPSQIGEGCELVNGIIEEGCRIFYGVKAVRFFMASHSQLKYGARLINSYLGNNATISCCEVLNSLIFPAHEQHHNNSFLCAALVMGQSNIAAGATIGSNHNSRAADGEIVAGRGFWPGLCVSLKHNSKFASFTLIAKGDYPAELNIPLPFSLVNNEVKSNKLVIMPAYWFLYNMYALARNSSKYVDRDKRQVKVPYIEYDFLAPDSVNEVFTALDLLREFTALAFGVQAGDRQALLAAGDALINEKKAALGATEITARGFENTRRPVQIIKVWEAYSVYKRLIVFYGITHLLQYIEQNEAASLEAVLEAITGAGKRQEWTNLGGQLMLQSSLKSLLDNIKSGVVNSWDEVHEYYHENSDLYFEQKRQHAFASLLEVLQLPENGLTAPLLKELLQQALQTKEWMVKNIYDSRAKDYESPYRQMVYENEAEMENVVGRLEDNVFIEQQQQELSDFTKTIRTVINRFRL
ncbi:DUF4954 family protein [Paraflavisolibacter sp. H34]|uniref:DUF4954 family protein n=1 Tax=Huijunlia imazamoxiresistens TaxID=3127457 RepID=UPI00301799B0